MNGCVSSTVRRVCNRLTSSTALLAFLLVAPSLAAGPEVAFDVSYSVECRDVTPEEFSLTNPDEKLIEATYRVSVLMLSGHEEDLDELMFVVISPARRLRVVDFLPRTEVATDIEGPVEVTGSVEDAKSFDVTLGGRAVAEYAGVEGQLSPSAGVGRTHRELSNETFKRLPPKHLLLASGTLAREYGVFFKLKPSTQASFEGMREFVVQYVVPRRWSGDWAAVDCVARATMKNYFREKRVEVGRKRVYVGLYQQGDVEAKAAARRLSESQRRIEKQLDEGSGDGDLTPGLSLSTVYHVAKPVLSLPGEVPGLSLLCGDKESSSPSQEPAPSFSDTDFPAALH